MDLVPVKIEHGDENARELVCGPSRKDVSGHSKNSL
jgi:hypothetical protein